MASLDAPGKVVLNGAYIFNKYVIGAPLALLVYDFLLTFGEENLHFWHSRLSLVQLLFFANRYLVFYCTIGIIYVTSYTDVNLNPHLCKVAFQSSSLLIFFAYCASESILYVRAYALWSCNRSVLVGLIAVYTVSTSLGRYPFAKLLSSYLLEILMGIDGYVNIKNTFQCTFRTSLDKKLTQLCFPIEVFPGCGQSFEGELVWLANATCIASETFALGMLIAKAYRMRHSTILRRMLEDGVVYYILVLVSTVAHTVITSTAPALLIFLTATRGVLHSIVCNRFLIRIRTEAKEPEVDSQLSNIRFEEGQSDDVASVARRPAHSFHET